MRKFHSVLVASASASAVLLLSATAAGAAAGPPRCDGVVRAETAIDHPTIVQLHCRGTVLHARVASPALHGVVDRLAKDGRTLRYTPSHGWFSPDGDRTPDRFLIDVENRHGFDRVPVRVTVVPQAPDCRDVVRRLAVTGRTTTVRLACDGLVTDPSFHVVTRPRHGRLRVDQSSGRVTYVANTSPARADRFRYRARNGGGASAVHTVVLRAAGAAIRTVGASARVDPVPATPTSGSTTTPATTTPTTTTTTPTTTTTTPTTTTTTPTTTTPATTTPTAPAPAVTCSSPKATTNYVTAVSVSVTCTGSPITLAPGSSPQHGELSGVSVSGTTATATYTPDTGYDDRFGLDSFTFVASDESGEAVATGTVTVDVRPYRFVAFGDSVTAGFGFYGDGSAMGATGIVGCRPPATVNGRCSSNSTLGPNATATPAYTPDFGQANGVSWAAQFANSLQGGELSAAAGMFANYAVTGSSPGDWLALPGDQPGSQSYPNGSGALTSQLNQILQGNPDLVAFTLGANPILGNMMPPPLGVTSWWQCGVGSFTWNSTLSCVEPLYGDGGVSLGQHLQALYTHLLQNTTTTKFVVMPYHLTVPSGTSAGWGWWQLEGGIDLLNQTIDNAVTAVQAAMPGQAGRLLHVKAQWDPNAAPNPEQLARFNYGGSSTHLNSPACVPAGSNCASGSSNDYGWDNRYDCHWYVSNADGPSHQSTATQTASWNTSTCGGPPWIISTDSGIHPNVAGYTRFASALENLVTDEGLVPALPNPPARR